MSTTINIVARNCLVVIMGRSRIAKDLEQDKRGTPITKALQTAAKAIAAVENKQEKK